jgi:hypothetical protein
MASHAIIVCSQKAVKRAVGFQKPHSLITWPCTVCGHSCGSTLGPECPSLTSDKHSLLKTQSSLQHWDSNDTLICTMIKISSRHCAVQQEIGKKLITHVVFRLNPLSQYRPAYRLGPGCWGYWDQPRMKDSGLQKRIERIRNWRGNHLPILQHFQSVETKLFGNFGVSENY